MIHPKTSKNRKSSRLQRIECKCDAILSELHRIRADRPDGSRSIDDAIDRMHRAARRMRADAANEAAMLSRMFHLK